MKQESENQITLEGIGKEIQKRLDKHFKQWGAGLPFKAIISNQAYRAKVLGMGVGELADRLEDEGFIKVLNTPNGARFIFSGDCPMTLDQMQDWLQEQEIKKESEKDFKKHLRSKA